MLVGMLIGFYFELKSFWVQLISCAFFMAFLACYVRAKKLIFPDALFGIATFLFIFCIGIWLAHFSQPTNQKTHYLHVENAILVEGKILEELKPNRYSNRYIFEVLNVYESTNTRKKAHGKILLSVSKDSLKKKSLLPGNLILTPFQTSEISSPLNPFQFSYKAYLKNLKIERQIHLSDSNWTNLNKNEIGLREYARAIRAKLILKLNEHDFTRKQLAVFQAIILGERIDLDETIYKDYAAAGAIHILAISGLHIGVLLILLNFLFKPIEQFKQGKIYKTILVIVLLWAFALLTGLSASVVRSVTMFSFLTVGIAMNRKTGTLNSLFLSFFFLLLINPYYIFQVGFQLSYLAVTGILLFQPLIEQIYKPRTSLPRYFWKLISVSIAAQLAVLPLSLYYFHQFPGLFLLTNVIVLPSLGILLIFGLLIIILAALGTVPDILVSLYGFLLNSLNNFINWVAAQEDFVWTDITFSLFQNILAYTIIIGLLIVVYRKTYQSLVLLLSLIILFQIASFWHAHSVPHQELVIFQKNRVTFIGIKKQAAFELYSNSADSISKLSIMTDYMRERKIKSYEVKEEEKLFSVLDKKLLLVNSEASLILPGFYPELVLLSNSPKVNLQRLIAEYKPQMIIADGNNYPGIIKKWKETCEKNKIPFHYTAKEGAFLLSPGKSF